MKINKKKLIVLIIVFMLCILFINQVQAATFDPNLYKPGSTSSVIGASKLEKIGNKVIGVVQVIGSISSVVAIVVIGIKYILGSVEEKAEYKQTLKPYLIGAILVFGISNVLSIVQNIIGEF